MISPYRMALRLIVFVPLGCSPTLLPGQETSGDVSGVAHKTVYSIQVGAFSELDRAEGVQRQLEADFDTVVLRDSGASAGRFKVSLGAFATYTEAWVNQQHLPPSVADSFVVSWPEAASDSDYSAGIALTPVPLGQEKSLSELFLEAEITLEPGSYTPEWEEGQVDVGDLTPEDLLRLGRNSSGKHISVAALERLLEEFPEEHDSSAARLMLARRLFATGEAYRAVELLRQLDSSRASSVQQSLSSLFLAYGILYQGDRSKARAEFDKLAANAELPVAVRQDAVRRYAGLAHADRDYPASWTAFDKLAKTGLDDETRAEAQMQLAGLAFELAGSGKGYWSEVRMLCERVVTNPAAPKRVRATAALMHLETHFMEGAYETLLLEAETFMDEHGGIERETAMAVLWKGISLARLGRLEEAEKVLTEVAAVNLGPDEKFANSEPAAKAALWLAWIAGQREDSEAQAAYEEWILESYPLSSEAARVRASGDEPLTGEER